MIAATALTVASPALADSSSSVFASSSSNNGTNSVSIVARTTGNGQVTGTATAGNETVRTSISGDRSVFVSNRSSMRDARGDAMIQQMRDRLFAMFK